MFDALIGGCGIVFTPLNLLIIFFATTLGVIIGIAPGIGPFMAVVVLLPFTFNIPAESGMLALMSIFVGGAMGGGITSAILGIPGTPMATATVFDAYPMSKKGQAGKAVGFVVTGSFFGGVFSLVVCIFTAPLLARVALAFGPPEYAGLALMGLSAVIALSQESVVKGIISLLIGLFLAAVGTDEATADLRFTFGMMQLTKGIDIVPVLLGLFSISKVLEFMEERLMVIQYDEKALIPRYPSRKEIWKYKGAYLRASVIGTIIGAIPGVGSVQAAFIAYAEAKRVSKHPELFGTGIPEGIISCESADNAVSGGALIPMLTLGIPGDAITAIVMATLFVHGLTPGPQFFQTQTVIITALYIGMIISNFLMLFLGMYGARLVMGMIARTKESVLIPGVALISMLATYCVSASLTDVWIMWVFGVVGYFLVKVKIPLSPIILAIILGPLFEGSFRRSLSISDGDFTIFITRPYSALILTLTVLLIVWPYLRKKPT